MVLMRLRRIMMQTDQYLRRLNLSFIVLGKYGFSPLMGAREYKDPTTYEV